MSKPSYAPIVSLWRGAAARIFRAGSFPETIAERKIDIERCGRTAYTILNHLSEHPMNDIPEILNALGTGPSILTALVETIPPDDMARVRGDGFWNITQHVIHLGAVQPVLLERIDRFLNEPNPEFVPHIPSEDEQENDTEPADVRAALDRFAEFRRKQIARLSGASPVDWNNTGIHPEYSAYSLYILARHILMHDHWHMYRMEELWLTRDAYLTELSG
jgi:uncharacterized damage-inducible protein DinB